MDDILASIRRIMLDEQARLQDGPGGPAHAAGPSPVEEVEEEDPVLILDSSMVIEDGAANFAVPEATETVVMVSAENLEAPPDLANSEKTPDTRLVIVTETVQSDAATGDVDVPVAHESGASAHTTVLGATGLVPIGLEPAAPPAVITSQAIEALMAPAAAAAAAASVEALLKQLTEGRLAALSPPSPPSPSIEEVVRSELRPYLKAWLDEHLPGIVERIVRAEISRLIGRSGV